MSEPLSTQTAEGVGTITLERPETLNVLDPAMAAGLARATRDLAEDTRVRCIVVRGAGEHFMAGGDIRHFRECLELAPEARRAAIAAEIDAVHEAIVNIYRSPKPVVASVRGACAGFGLSLMAACDLAIAAEDSVLCLAYIRLGISPDGGSTWSLARAAGMKRAMELALLGDRLTPRQALDYGLVNWVVPSEDLEARTDELARRLAAGPVHALANTRSLLLAGASATLAEQLEAEKGRFLNAILGPEFDEGVRAFLDKRPAEFPHDE